MNKNDKYNDEDIIIKKASQHKFFSTLIAGQKFWNYTDGLVNLTKYNLQKRGELLTRFYRNLFISGYLIQDGQTEAYEIHYESFMHNNKRDEAKYSEILAECVENKKYLYIINEIKQIESLINQGLDVSKLPNINKQLVEKTLQLKKDCGFGKDFSYEDFYIDNKLRTKVSQKINYYIKDIENIKNKYEEETM